MTQDARIPERARAEAILARRAELARRMAEAAGGGDYAALAREYAELEEVAAAAGELVRLARELAEAEALAGGDDAEMAALAREEARALQERLAAAQARFRELLVAGDADEARNVILEIRAGAGGEEAALFAADLFRMYARYAERKGWRVELLSANATGLGGYKEIVARIVGKGAFARLRFESGVHRVQRVPETESGGRIHTSTATVAVLPEAEEVEVEIRPDELRIETFRAQGAGGQHVNKTESAVRITHIPTGIVVQCQNERSQHQNRAAAMRMLRARLYQRMREAQQREIAEARRGQIGTGDRSERIRTYNFPQGRVTDHRIKLTLHRLDEVLDGDLDEIVDALVAAEREAALSASA